MNILLLTWLQEALVDVHPVGVMAAPLSYAVDGEQYIAVLAGWGGIFPLTQGKGVDQSGNTRNISRVLVFKLGGAVRLPPVGPPWAHAAYSARHRGCGHAHHWL